jgi:hypothetical protein
MVRLDWDSAGAADFAGVGKGTLSTLMPSQFYSLDRWGSAMHILCPHCRNPIEVVKLNLREEITCPSCGSSLHLETESTTNWQRAAGQNLGKYELLATVGQGAFGTVYKARDPELDRGIAISRGMARPVETEERAPVEIPNRRHPLTSTKPCHARLGHGHSTRLALRRQRRVGSRRPCGRLEESSPAGGRRTESPREGYSGGGGSGTSPPEGSDSSVRSRRHCCGPGRPRLYDAGQLSPPNTTLASGEGRSAAAALRSPGSATLRSFAIRFGKAAPAGAAGADPPCGHLQLALSSCAGSHAHCLCAAQLVARLARR